MTALALKHTENAQDLDEVIQCELFSDPRVEVETLKVYVDNCEVTLAGTATSYAAKLYAEDAVRRIHGVRSIRNHVHVVIHPLKFKADCEIADAVRHTLRWNSLLPGQRLNCVVDDGWVLIIGKVSAEYQKEEAEASIAHIAGVKGILNDIVVTG